MWKPDFDMWQVVLRAILAVLVGGIIGIERARHGRAAGMRTHMLVCLGAAMTAMTGLFVHEVLGITGDVFRIPAQVISGVGFLGAGVIVLKQGDVITGLTTAAGVWATGAIGVAIGYGFYVGALAGVLLLLISLVFFSKLERNRKDTDTVYLELDCAEVVNEVLEQIKAAVGTAFHLHIAAPHSGIAGHVGLTLTMRGSCACDTADLLKIPHVAFAITEEA